MTRLKRPTKGAHARDLEKYAKALGWTEQGIRNGGHSVWINGSGRKVPIPRCGTQPIAVGTIFSILRDLEAE